MSKPFSQPISEARRIEALRIKADLAKLALYAWDPNANLAAKLRERAGQRNEARARRILSFERYLAEVR